MADNDGRKGTGNNGGWNSFIQSREVQIALYGVVVVFCVYYAIDAVIELMDPARSAMLIEAMGQTTYYIVTIARAVVCLGTGVAFARMTLRIARDK